MSIRCEISTVQIDALMEAGFIDPVMRDDAAEVARGVERSLGRLSVRPPAAPVSARAEGNLTPVLRLP
jgi:hypothetical protein